MGRWGVGEQGKVMDRLLRHTSFSHSFLWLPISPTPHLPFSPTSLHYLAQVKARPPSMLMVSPVIHAALSDAKKAIS